MASNQDIIGREDVNDLEAILSVTNTEVDAIQHAVRSESDALFTWDYEQSRPALVKLYEKAKTSQWNAVTDLDWSIEVDQEKVVLANAEANPALNGLGTDFDVTGTSFAKWGDKEWIQDRKSTRLNSSHIL